MEKGKFEIIGVWEHGTADGSVFRAHAVTLCSRRIIARAQLSASLDGASDFLDAFGEFGRDEIERAVSDACLMAALKFPEAPE